MENEQNIYNLELHKSSTLPCGITIMRVPGGWLYDMWDSERDCSKQGVFVPFHNEFMMSTQDRKDLIEIMFGEIKDK